MATLWLVDPAALLKPSGTTRKIGRKPLINLVGLQAAIDAGTMGDDDVVLATRDCASDLRKFPWTIRDLLDCLRCVRPFQTKGYHDFKGSEWCKNSAGQSFPCDVYATRYDEGQRCWSHLGLEIYLKFSITEDGELELIMISVHV
jgi:hypothetical protein